MMMMKWMKKLDMKEKECKKRFLKRAIWTSLLFLLPGTLLSLYYNQIATFLGAVLLTLYVHFFAERNYDS